jgi:O-antigen ligase
MLNRLLKTVETYRSDKDLLTLWMNNLLVFYEFLLPISQKIKATVFLFILILFLLRGNIIEYIKESLSNKVVRSFIYIFLIYVIGMLWTEDIAEGLSAINSIKYGLYLIIFYSFVDGRYIDKVVAAFIFGMLVSELTSYSMMFGIMPWKLELFGILFYSSFSIGDPSPFLHHIHYGVALALVVMLIGQKIVSSKSTLFIKMAMSIFVLTATSNIFVTGGRTGYITFFLLVSVLSLFYLRKLAVLIIVALFLVVTIAYQSSPIFKERALVTEKNIAELFNENPNFNSSLGARAGVLYYAADLVQKHFIFGVGTGDAMNEIRKLTPERYNMIHELEHLHNQYISIFVSLGIVGLFIFLNIFYQIFKFKQNDTELRFIMIFSTLAIAFGILTTQFNLRFFMPLWVVMLAVTLISRDRKTIVTMQLNDKKQILQIIALGTVFSVSSLLHQLM